MSEGQAPAAAIKTTLDEIKNMLSEVTQNPEHEEEMVRLIVQGYGIVQQAVQAIQEQGQRVEHLLRVLTEQLVRPLEPVVPLSWSRRWVSRPWVLASVLLLGIGVGVVGLVQRENYGSFATNINRVLREEWGGLPKGVQDKVLAVYTAEHLPLPRPTQGGKK